MQKLNQNKKPFSLFIMRETLNSFLNKTCEGFQNQTDNLNIGAGGNPTGGQNNAQNMQGQTSTQPTFIEETDVANDIL